MDKDLAITIDAGFDLVAALEPHGYQFTEFTKLGGEFVATAVKPVALTTYRAQAIGRTRQIAAQQLVRTITRK